MLDLRSGQSPIKDQGRRGTCVAFAATAGHEMLRAEGVDLAEEFLHWAAKQRDGMPLANGTTLDAAAAALADLGQPLEEIWPYEDGRDHRAPTYQPPVGASLAAKARRLNGGGHIESSAQRVRGALNDGLAVLLGVRLYSTLFSPAANGRIEMPTVGPPIPGGHAVLVVGYIDGEGEGGGRFIIRNSWGGDWGANGYAFLPYAYVDANGMQSWGLELNAGREGERIS